MGILLYCLIQTKCGMAKAPLELKFYISAKMDITVKEKTIVLFAHKTKIGLSQHCHVEVTSISHGTNKENLTKVPWNVLAVNHVLARYFSLRNTV